VIWPVCVNSILLLLIAVLFNRLSGKDYPHRALTAPQPKLTLDDHAPLSLGVTAADLQTAIAERDEVVSVDPMDLEELLHRAEALAFVRQSGGTTASRIMTKAVDWGPSAVG
jgi:CBS domain-containing membrane protein